VALKHHTVSIVVHLLIMILNFVNLVVKDNKLLAYASFSIYKYTLKNV